MESWQVELSRGHSDAAWDLFVERYRQLIFATIRHLATDYDDVMDVFASVCEALRENDLARLRKYAERKAHGGRLSTWLVAVVRNKTIDWFRHRDGRKRMSSVVAELPVVQQKIFQYVFHESRSHLEAYELLQTRDGFDLPFREFLRALNATYRALSKGRRGRLMRELVGAPPPPKVDAVPEIDMPARETREHLARALADLAPEDRLAVQLFVIDDVPATEVARIVGWPSAKTVYNRVSRALAALHTGLTRRGIGSSDV
jgi:RNA polymerase sigma factor (sigma-70 family)